MNNLPTINALYKGELAENKEADAFVALMNQSPSPEWVKDHPIIKKEITVDGVKYKVPYQYLPIERVEWLLKSVFKRYRIEITGQGVSFNGVWVTVRVHYVHPLFGEWDFHDGIGAVQLQTAKGKSAADLANINNGAITMAFPHAKTLAIKDACDHFGRLFGSDLNRADVGVEYEDPTHLVPFERGHPKWEKAVKAVIAGTVTIAQIEKHYNLTDVGLAQMMEDTENKTKTK